MKYNMNDIQNLSFHDNLLYGFSVIYLPDEYICQLIFDIDYICEWIENVPPSYRISPAKLIFSDVSKMKVNINDSFGTDNAIGVQMWINDIKMEYINTKMYKKYYKYKIILSSINEGEISFTASDVELITHKKSIICKEQNIKYQIRHKMIKKWK